MSNSSDYDDGVFTLLTELCKSIAIDSQEYVKPTAVGRYREVAYKILWRYPLNAPANDDCSIDLVQDELVRQILITQLELSFDPDMFTRFERLISCENLVKHNEFLSVSPGKDALIFLLKLTKPDVKPSTVIGRHWKSNRLLATKAFTLHDYSQYNKNYPHVPLKSRPKYFKIVHTKANGCNNMQRMSAKFKIPFKLRTNITMQMVRTTHFGHHALQFNAKIPTMRLYRNRMIDKQPPSRQTKGEVKLPDGNAKKTNNYQPPRDLIAHSWESFEGFGARCYKHFVSDVKMAFELKAFDAQSKGIEFAPAVMSNDVFIEDLKALTIGIQSETFQYDNYNKFSMAKNTTVAGILPNELQSFVQPFLDCGASYKHLNILASHTSYNHYVDGFIYKSMCGAVADFLSTFRQFVLAQRSKRLVNLHRNMSRMMDLLIELDMAVAVEPQVDMSQNTKGSFFLTYIWQQIQESTKKDFLTLLTFLLKRLCNVYYKHLEKWVYDGVLDDPCNELFIKHVDHYQQRTKYCFDRAYFVQTAEVPGFLQGYHKTILNCGKYTMLLRHFKPKHSLFQMKHSPIALCLNEDEMLDLRADCAVYLAHAQTFCPPISMEDVFTERAEAKRNFKLNMQQRQQIHTTAWATHQQQMRHEKMTKKKQLLDDLNAQRQDNQQRKLSERTRQLALELQLEQYVTKYEQEKLLRDKCKLGQRIKSLQDVSKETESRLISLATLPSQLTGYLTDNERLQFPSRPVHCIQRSQSDLLNSNVTAVMSMPELSTDLARNRERVLQSTAFSFNSTNVKASDNGTESATASRTTLDEGRRNKLRVLTESTAAATVQTADINLNLLRDTGKNESAELQRNRAHMIKSDLFTLYNREEDAHTERAKLKLNLNSERAQNRRRVLDSEFHIFESSPRNMQPEQLIAKSLITQEEDIIDDPAAYVPAVGNQSPNTNHTNHSNISENVDCTTPMSTTSDISVATLYEECQEELWDVCNNNNNNRSKHSSEEHIQRGDSMKDNDTNSGEVYHDAQSDFGISLSQDKMSGYPTDAGTTESNSREINFSYDALKSERSRLRLAISSPLLSETNRAPEKHCTYVNFHDTVMIKKYLQRSLMLPLQTYFSLVRNEVMRIFLDDLRIYDQFRSLRNYFFLMDGEFGELITDGIIGQLENGVPPEKLLSYQTLHGVLNKAISETMTGATKYSGKLTFLVRNRPASFKLSSPDVLNVLSLYYAIDWPLNLVLNPKALDCYASIFQYLFKVRRISFVLDRAYQYLKEPIRQRADCNLLNTSPQYRHIQMIRHKLAHFVNALQNYLWASVLQSSWKKFKDVLYTVDTVESLYQAHAAYLKEINFLCLLNRKSAKIRECINNIFKITLRFYSVLITSQFSWNDETAQYVHERYSRLVHEEQEFEKFLKYTIYLGKKVVQHGYQDEIRHFIRLINFNDYYKENLASSEKLDADVDTDIDAKTETCHTARRKLPQTRANI